MRTLPDDKDTCEVCGKRATVHTSDGGDFCRKHAKEEIVKCHDCGEKMAYTVSVYRGSDGNDRCQLCDGEFELSQPSPWDSPAERTERCVIGKK